MSKIISAKDTEEYVASQPDVSAVFEKHAELSTRRSISGHYDIHIYNRGRWRRYPKISHPSARRVECLKRKYGTQEYFSRWDFPDRIESKIDVTQTVKELGFWQYVEEDANA